MRGVILLREVLDVALEHDETVAHRGGDLVVGDVDVLVQSVTDRGGERRVGVRDAREGDSDLVRDVEDARHAMRGLRGGELVAPRGDGARQRHHPVMYGDADLRVGEARVPVDLVDDLLEELDVGLLRERLGPARTRALP